MMVLLGVFALICPPAIARADADGSLAGFIIDSCTNAPLAGAAIDIESDADVRKMTSDSRGHYVALGLTPGTYTITVKRPGYATTQVVSMIVRPSQQSFAKILMPRQLTTLLRDFVQRRTDLVQPAQTTDTYVVRWNMPFFDASGMGGIYLLNFAPGLQTAIGEPNTR